MVLTIIDNEIVAKKCSRTYLKFNMSFRKAGRTLDSFATQIDLDDITDDEKKAYHKLQREFKKKTGIDIKITKEFSNKPKDTNWGTRDQPYKDIYGKFLSEAHFAKPLWITELKLSPELKQLKASVVSC